MSKDVGIALIANETIVDAAHRLSDKCFEILTTLGITVLPQHNIPHMTMFQLHVYDPDLSSLANALRKLNNNLSDSPFTLDAKLTHHDGYVFWTAHAAKTAIPEFHQQIVDTARQYRSKTHLFTQLSEDDLYTYQNEIHEYGVYWQLPHNFNPHVTLVYNATHDEHIPFLLNEIECPRLQFLPKSLAIVELGPRGEALKILAEIKSFESVAPDTSDSTIAIEPTPVLVTGE